MKILLICLLFSINSLAQSLLTSNLTPDIIEVNTRFIVLEHPELLIAIEHLPGVEKVRVEGKYSFLVIKGAAFTTKEITEAVKNCFIKHRRKLNKQAIHEDSLLNLRKSKPLRPAA